MRAATDAGDYTADPDDSYLALPRGLVFSTRRVWGFALWGKPTEADVRRLVPLLALELTAAPHASLVDASRLDAGDPRAFAMLARYLRDNFDTFRTCVTRLALVRPPGLLGATVAGFFQVAHAPYPVRVFEATAPAAAWLRMPIGPLAHAIDTASKTTPELVALRRWLDGHLGDAQLARAAKVQSRAPRSLQRDLAAAGTSFQREVDAARVRLAKRLLADSDAPLTEIAYDIGCASPQHFSALFRRVVGERPSAWRTRVSARRPRRGRDRASTAS